MGCVFCATGQMGFARNLTSTEIFEQAMRFARELEAEGDRLSNVVLMGMGEPFHNYDAVLEAIHRLMNDSGHWCATHHCKYRWTCSTDSTLCRRRVTGHTGD